MSSIRNASTAGLRGNARVSPLAVLSLAVVSAFALSGMPRDAGAALSPCMATAAGQPDLNCVANDLGVASFHITSISEGCTDVGDTMTFDGEVNLAAGSTQRYDLGFYIGYDSIQAYTGNCTVGIVPNSLVNLDGDTCGDFNKSPLAVPLTGVVATCRDSNRDGFYDLAICASYDQNANTACNNASQAVPGTGSKCQCSQVETDLEVPHCDTNADCADDGNVCTTEVCNTLQSGLGDLFGCSHNNNTLPCSDGVFCNGADTCSGGTCVHAGNPCTGGPSCGNSCNEDADNCLVAAGTVCRASSGVCDVPETCTGTTLACPPNSFAASTTGCRASSGVCDPAESCTGTSAACPANTLRPTSFTCRASTGVCDPAESCTGTSGACPAAAFLPSSTICRASSAICDVAESCTGTSGACPTQAFVPSSFVCRGSSGVCDFEERCTGTSASCPANAFVPSSTTCRESAGVCDVAEKCTGTSGACPSNVLAATSVVCRDSTGVCDGAESCDGTSVACPGDGMSTSVTVCRSSVGVCDSEEFCTGTTGACPTDAATGTGTVCRAATGVCDVDESCSGTSPACPPDTFVPVETECRPSAGVCDPAETCSGTSGDCPAEAFSPTTTPCRASTGVCDAAESCDGTSAVCQADVLSTSSDICRPAATDCDVAETCTGTCQHQNNTAPCDDGLFCTGDDVCVDGTCTHDGDPCAEGGECADACNEAADSCFDPNTTPCTSDDNVCTNDFCSGAGTCAHTPNTLPCDDGVYCNGVDVCTGGACGHSGDPCAGGPQCQDVCDEEEENCFDTDGNPCEKECTIPGTGVCTDGECEGTDITLSPSCRWIVIGGVGPVTGGGTVKTTGVRNDGGSHLAGSVCGFYSFRTRGFTAGDFVVTSGVGQGFKGAGIKFAPSGDVGGDIVTGKSMVKAGVFSTVPGTGLATIDANQVIERLDDLLVPTGTFVDTTGTHDLVEVCDEDQDKLTDAMEILDALPATTTYGKVKLKLHGTMDLTADGVTVLDYASLKIGGQSTVTIHGGADDSLIIRTSGDLKIGVAADIVLTGGIKPESVLFYGKGGRCRVGRNSTGAGTWLCPFAKRFIFGFGTEWRGTILGGTDEIRIRRNVDLEHEPFTAF